MTGYILKRFMSLIPTIWIIITISFFLIRLAPGGPFDAERNVPQQVLVNLEKKFHLDQPLYKQYASYMMDLCRGDFGPSFKYYDHDVNFYIFNALPNSILLGVLAIGYALIAGVATGIISAVKQNSIWDYIPMSIAVMGISIPNFVVGPVLVFIFALKLSWLPTSGWYETSPAGWLTLIMPSFTLGLGVFAVISRLTRTSVIEILKSDYIRTARAKGLKESVIIYRHVLKGAMLPIVTYLGPAFSAVITGGVVVEMIFTIPGLGKFFVQSAFNRDYTLIMGTVIVYSVILIVMNFLVDIAYTYLDPRISYE